MCTCLCASVVRKACAQACIHVWLCARVGMCVSACGCVCVRTNMTICVLVYDYMRVFKFVPVRRCELE